MLIDISLCMWRRVNDDSLLFPIVERITVLIRFKALKDLFDIGPRYVR